MSGVWNMQERNVKCTQILVGKPECLFWELEFIYSPLMLKGLGLVCKICLNTSTSTNINA